MLTCLKAPNARACVSRLTQIKWLCCCVTYSCDTQGKRATQCSNQASWVTSCWLSKSEISRLLSMPAHDMFEAAEIRSEALADQIKASLSELGETLSEEEEHVERLIAERPMAALASAFALGIAIGFLLRRN